MTTTDPSEITFGDIDITDLDVFATRHPHEWFSFNLFTGSSRSDADRGANTLLRWKAASHLYEEGVVRLDLNGARPGPAGRFKASLAADLVPRWDLHQPDHRPVALLQRATARARQELKSAWSLRGAHR
jgi:hypothetical protein